MNIRQAIPTDAAAIYELGKTVGEFVVSDQTINFWPKELLTSAIKSDDVMILVAEEQTVQGFLIVNYNKGLRKALIENIYVHPDARGHGIGDQLLDVMFKRLSALGCEYIATLVPPDAHDALDLYARAGLTRGETFVWLDMVLDDRFKK